MSATSSDEAPYGKNPTQRRRLEKVKIYEKRKKRNIALLFALWYVLSVAFNIFSKKALVMAPELAWTAAWAQMCLGLFYVVPVWLSGLRAPPQVSASGLKRLMPVALLHALVHVGGVVSMGAGAVSFTYIVKASEPAVSAALSAVMIQSYLPLPVYLTLVPVMAGVALSSLSELSFNWKAFNYAMVSNVASASRSIVGKSAMKHSLGKNLTAVNLYAVLTVIASIVIFPVAMAIEGPVLKKTIQSLFAAGLGWSYVLNTCLAAVAYYGYNEVAFVCLDHVSPVSHALANTLKRVFIIISSIIVFGNKMTPQGILGSIMAVGGVLLYSLTKQKYNKKK